MEENALLRGRKILQAIQAYKDSIRLKDYLKNLLIIVCLSIPSIMIGYGIAGWLGVIAELAIIFCSSLVIRYIIDTLFPWELRTALRNLEQKENFKMNLK